MLRGTRYTSWNTATAASSSVRQSSSHRAPDEAAAGGASAWFEVVAPAAMTHLHCATASTTAAVGIATAAAIAGSDRANGTAITSPSARPAAAQPTATRR